MLRSHLLQKAKDIFVLLQRRSNSAESRESRAVERQRRIAISAIGAVAAKASSLLTALVSVPLTYGYLGEERYGLWMVISSVLAMMAFADLGLGNGLVNRLAEAYAKEDRTGASKYVSTAFFLLSGVALLLGIIFVLAYPALSWGKLFNVSSQVASEEAGPAICVFVTCFLLGLPLGVAPRIQMGFQEGLANGLWSIGGNLLALSGILLAVKLRLGLPWLVLAMAGGPLVAIAANATTLFFYQRKWLRPVWENVDVGSARSLFKLGLMFFVLQVTFAVGFMSDNFIATHVLSAAAVAEYALVLRLFLLIPSILEMLIQPLWPAYGEAVARGDFSWVKRTLTNSLLLSVGLVMVTSAVLVLFGERILSLWARHPIQPSFGLLIGAAMWTVLSVAGTVTAAFLNGTGSIRFQAVCAVAMSVAALVIKIYLGKNLGLTGIIWGTVLAYSVFIAVPMAIYVPFLLRRMSKGYSVEEKVSCGE